MRLIKYCLLLVIAGFLANCNRECRNLSNTESGGIVKPYEFGGCFLYTSLDSQVVVDDTGKWTAFKQKYLKYCDTQNLENIDFSKHMLVGYKLKVYACNVAFHRKLIVDDSAKTYTYFIEIEVCKGCNTELASPNWVIMPKLPAGYSLQFKNSIR
jgi:hypothetical protein